MRGAKLLFSCCLWFVLSPIVPAQSPRQPLGITSTVSGIRLTVDEQNDLAAIRVLLPGQSDSDPGIFVLFPERVTAREHGRVDSQQLYLFRPASVEPSGSAAVPRARIPSGFPPGVHGRAGDAKKMGSDIATSSSRSKIDYA
jgi:hypothetical protein